MSGLRLQLPAWPGRALSWPVDDRPPPPVGRRLANGAIIVIDEAQPDRLWKFTAWERSALAANELDIYARLRDLQDEGGIVRLLGVGASAEHLIRTVERAHRGEARKYLREAAGEGGLLATETVRVILGRIASAMAGLHALDIVHRDLKAENVLLFDGDVGPPTPKVADFDRAIELSRGERLEEPVGSLFHMAPEILAWAPYDRRVDVYAFGVLMFEVAHGGARAYAEVATGMPGAITASEFAQAVIADGLRPDWRHPDPALKELAASCLSADPEARPEFDEIVERLAAAPYPARKSQAETPAVGMAANIGRRRPRMEDAATVLEAGETTILGVYDGALGDEAGVLAARGMALILAQAMRDRPDEPPEEPMREAFGLIQATLDRLEPPPGCGSTATLALVRPDHVLTAWVGDSPAWLFRRTEDGGVSAASLIRPHRLDRPDEAARAIAAGGEVRRERKTMDSGEQIPWGPLRLFAPGAGSRTGVTLTRALGFASLAPAISHEPELMRTERGPDDLFLILGSDGVFDVLTPKQAGDLRLAARTAQEAADRIIAHVLEMGAPDNASVIICDLRRG